jgi:hypothetical protein
MNALDRETRDTLRLCWDFLKLYQDLFLDTDYYRMKRDFIMVRKEMSGVLIRHEKKRKTNDD